VERSPYRDIDKKDRAPGAAKYVQGDERASEDLTGCGPAGDGELALATAAVRIAATAAGRSGEPMPSVPREPRRSGPDAGARR